MAISLDILMGLNGGEFIDSTTTGTTADNFKCLYFNEDSVLTALTDTEDNNLLTEWGLSGKTIGKGAVIGSASGYPLKTVTFSSGSGLLLKG